MTNGDVVILEGCIWYKTSDRTRLTDVAVDVKEGYRQTVATGHSSTDFGEKGKEGRCSVQEPWNSRWGPSGLYCLNVDQLVVYGLWAQCPGRPTLYQAAVSSELRGWYRTLPA